MRRMRVCLIVAAMVIACQIAGSGAVQASDLVAGSPGSDRVASERQVRLQFGLNADPSYVASVDEASPSVQNQLSIPLSAAELSEMSRRDAVGRSFASLESAALNGSFPEFAGAWIDQAAGGIAVVQVTQDSPAVRSHMADLIPAVSLLDVRVVRRSFAHLKPIADHLTQDMPALNTAGVHVSYVAYSPYADAVLVTVDPSTSAASYKSVLAGYGDGDDLQISEHIGPVVNPTVSHQATTGPAYGGLRIFGPSGGCTVSSTAVSSVYWIVTAGHCGSYNAAWKQGTSSGPSVGTGFSNGFYDYAASYCDCQAVGSIPSSKATGYVIDAYGGLQPEYYLPTTANYYSGAPVCMSGASINGVTCGVIYTPANSYTFSEGGHTTTMVDQAYATYVACGGDSGGGVTTGNTYMGIQSVGVHAIADRLTPDEGVQHCYDVVGFSKLLPADMSYYLSSTTVHA